MRRRSFAGLLIGVIWATITGTIGAISARFFAAPNTASGSAAQWAEVGMLNDFPDGKATKLEVAVTQDAGWARFSSVKAVWIVRRDRNATVFSAVCPHLGCTVDASAIGFVCPCHSSSWNVNGEKLGGPTPRGLDVVESRIENNLIKVRYQDLRQGASNTGSV